MKKILFISLFISLLIFSSAYGGEKKTIKVLFIGNSQMYKCDLPQMVQKISQSLPSSPQIEVGRVILGGRGLMGFWEKGDAEKGLPRSMINADKWDYVILQEAYIINKDGFKKYASLFNDAIKKNGSKTIFFATASIAKLYPEGFKKLNDVQLALGKQMKIPVAAAGYAWMKYWGDTPTESQRLELYNKDLQHPGKKGTYLYACILYSIITGENCKGATRNFKFLGGDIVTSEEAEKMQDAAWKQYLQDNK